MANNRIKDEIFDWKQILNFAGETGPYMQYAYLKSQGKDKYKTNVFVEKGVVLAEIQRPLGEDEEFFLSSNNCMTPSFDDKSNII